LGALEEGNDVGHARAGALVTLCVASATLAALESGLHTRAACVVAAATVALTVALVQILTDGNDKVRQIGRKPGGTAVALQRDMLRKPLLPLLLLMLPGCRVLDIVVPAVAITAHIASGGGVKKQGGPRELPAQEMRFEDNVVESKSTQTITPGHRHRVSMQLAPPEGAQLTVRITAVRYRVCVNHIAELVERVDITTAQRGVISRFTRQRDEEAPCEEKPASDVPLTTGIKRGVLISSSTPPRM
jgi:hypothetical protein